MNPQTPGDCHTPTRVSKLPDYLEAVAQLILEWH